MCQAVIFFKPHPRASEWCCAEQQSLNGKIPAVVVLGQAVEGKPFVKKAF